MKSNSFIAILVMLLSVSILSYGQKEGQNNMQVKPLTFIVRNGGKINEIAASIKVPAAEILKANKLRSKQYLAYPGRMLIIPVRVQPRTWDPTREGMTGRSPSKADRHQSEEFELVIDSSNYKLEEDFINLTDAREDSTEYENIGIHIRKIDKRIQTLYYKIDSMKQVDFKFEDESAPDPVSIRDNMKMSRDKYYSQSPLGRQVDSLKAVKVWLGQRRIVLRNQITEYEYLVDNAGYSERTYRHQTPKETEFGKNLAYESIYLRSRDPAMAANGKKKSISSAAAENAAAGLSADKDLVEKNEPAISRTSKVNVIIHHKSDYALINNKTFTSEIQSTTPYHRTLLLLKGGAIEPAPEKPVAKEVIKKIRENRADDKHTGTLIANPSERSSTRAPETKADNVVEKPKPVNPAPKADYSQDSIHTPQTKPTQKGPGKESQKIPKYMEPVDSVTRIKSQFYIILAREALAKGDFKNGEKDLRKCLDINPNNAEAWMLHADIYLTQGASDQSLKEYIISSEIDSLNPKVFYNIALLYSKTNSQKANTYFSRAIEVNNKYLPAYMGRASLLMDGNAFDKAVADYDKVLAIDKSYSAAYKGRGLARMEQRKYADAIADFDMYLMIEKPDGFVLFQRGLSKIYSNDLLKGCLDLSAAKDLGFKEAEKAIKKFCQ